MVNKHPAKTNLGGLWLLNPHAPRCTQTNLQGLAENGNPTLQPKYGTTLHDGFRPGGTAYAGAANALPPAWLIDIPSNILILTGNQLPEDGTFYEHFRGEHILQLQRFDEAVPLDGKSHPRFFRSDLGHMPPVNHVVWYDSIVRHELDIPGVISEIGPNGIWRGFLWSLYFGAHPDQLESEAATDRAWWLVAGLEPNAIRSVTDSGRAFFYKSLWRFSHPATDSHVQGNSVSTDDTARYNSLGKNVFKRYNSFPADELTIEPFYG